MRVALPGLGPHPACIIPRNGRPRTIFLGPTAALRSLIKHYAIFISFWFYLFFCFLSKFERNRRFCIAASWGVARWAARIGHWLISWIYEQIQTKRTVDSEIIKTGTGKSRFDRGNHRPVSGIRSSPAKRLPDAATGSCSDMPCDASLKPRWYPPGNCPGVSYRWPVFPFSPERLQFVRPAGSLRNREKSCNCRDRSAAAWRQCASG